MTSQELSIHPTAIVDPAAEIGSGVQIGPYCIIGPNIVLGDGCRLHAHVVLEGRTRIGAETEIFPFSSIGQIPQDLKYGGEPSELVIGARNVIREHVTMNIGTEGGGMITKVGDSCLFMAGSHVAHDCVVGDNVILANNATIAGHVTVGDFAILGGLSAARQFVRIGKHAMIGGLTGVENDVIPFGTVMGDRARLSGLNLIGLKRRGFTQEQIAELRKAYRLLFADEGTFLERVDSVAREFSDNEVVTDIVGFIRATSSRGAICQPGRT
ncbi:acyl-ACP--UDP-N-acetylglucosamine O-acyltransferase [Nisaea sp.]|uniref:acyl-ACP--UDP-N-acetylglucosamine O-acyltransferase n=1 Tax=Nisaea sp. TaxID=2024842 RepID=UPI003265D81E